ncbi:DUF2840 domain-containing protein [Sphingopyxis sp.]|uniref:DUF2840 domain-containing protein n=1 Tax=Sphingopyxis sp. TaxID=1908224 RepID=UPI002D79E05D|nr:DUF2840 domain-containing protein [Sphingopyxis sp.]HET6523546.1 DUF2840 domain-containing protein [Sphingopyxis sp.]
MSRAAIPARTCGHFVGAAPAAVGVSGNGLTDVELTWIEQHLGQSIRFGRVAAERIAGSRTRIVSFRPGTIFALVRWTSNDFGTVHASLAIIAARAPEEPFDTHPFVRPGGDILLRIDGRQQVRTVVGAIDAVDAAGIDPCDAAPDHWRHVGSRLAANLPFRPYGTERHAGWLQRKARES